MTGVLPLALVLYWIVEYVVRRVSYPARMEPPGLRPPWIREGSWAILISPGFWLSHYFTNRTSHFDGGDAILARRILIERSNLLNLVVSSVFVLVGLAATLSTRGRFGWSLVADFAVLRYFSRTVEIGYAFGRDVMKPVESRSGLDKHARLALALRSYIELFFLAIPVYLLCLPGYCTLIKAVTLSLSVGTLTNVGYGLTGNHEFRALLVFPQVFATLSLVLLSLASYISRPDKHQAL